MKGCVFLLAVDQEVIERAISFKYKDLLTAAREAGDQPRSLATFLGRNYFEKIIQLPFSLPPLSKDDIESLISSLCTDQDAILCSGIFASGLPRNPRKVKRVLQVFLFLRDLAIERVRDGTIKPSLLAKLVVIRDQFRVLYREIVDTPVLLETLEKYYRHRMEAQASRDTPLEQITEDPILREKVQVYASEHPQLRGVLLQAATEDDTFVGAPIEDYIFFIRAVTETRPPVREALSKETLTLALGRYLRYVLETTRYLVLQGISLSEATKLKLAELFLAPRFAAPSIVPRSDDVESTELDQVLRTSGRVLIVGDPGSGKTTLLRYVAETLSTSMVDDNASLVEARLGLRDGLLPILVPLVEYDWYAREHSDLFSGPAPRVFTEFLDEYFTRWNIDIPAGFFSEYLERGKCMVLLDGLDEVAEPQRYFVAESINALTSRYPANRYLVTTRPIGFEQGVQLTGFETYTMFPWSDEQISAFVHRWYEVLRVVAELGPSRTQEMAESLCSAISHYRPIRVLAGNPLLLTVIVLIHHYRALIPEARASLYHESVDLLLSRWDRAKGLTRAEPDVSLLEMRRLLATLALQMQESRNIEVGEAKIVETFSRTIEPTEKALAVLSMIRERSGLLVETAMGIYAFVTRSFQEYFAALELTTQRQPVQATLEHKDDVWWREVILFVAGIFGLRGDRVLAGDLLRSLLDAGGLEDIVLAGECLLEIGPSRGEDTLARQTVEALSKMDADENLDPSVRGQASKILEQIGLTRAGST